MKEKHSGRGGGAADRPARAELKRRHALRVVPEQHRQADEDEERPVPQEHPRNRHEGDEEARDDVAQGHGAAKGERVDAHDPS